MTILIPDYISSQRDDSSISILCLRLIVCFLLCFSLFFASNYVQAQIDKELFSGQRMLFNKQEPVASKHLTLGLYKKINGQWVVEKEKRFEAALQSYTFELSDRYTLESAWREVQNYFNQKKSLLLFECEGVNCGSSSAWANERFHVQQLYGQDLSQRYQVRKIEQAEENYYASVYLVQRGNRRIYFHVELLFPVDDSTMVLPNLDVGLKSFIGNGFIELQGLRFTSGELVFDENSAQYYAEIFRRGDSAKLIIVGHDYQSGSEQESIARSQAHAEAVKKILVTHGVNAARIDVRGVGFLAPDGSARVAKVVVLRRH